MVILPKHVSTPRIAAFGYYDGLFSSVAENQTSSLNCPNRTRRNGIVGTIVFQVIFGEER